jgi:hypothetical protein
MQDTNCKGHTHQFLFYVHDLLLLDLDNLVHYGRNIIMLEQLEQFDLIIKYMWEIIYNG